MNKNYEKISGFSGLSEKINKRECLLKSPEQNISVSEANTKLIIASILCFVFFLAEIIGGILANSLAILTDSAHLLSDLSSFFISLGAVYLSQKDSSKSMNYGWYRTEILGALFSVILIWTITIILIYIAILRIIKNNFDLNASLTLIMATVGVIINIILALVLHPHSHSHEKQSKADENTYNDVLEEQILESDLEDSNSCMKIDNINLRAAFIHVIGDILQSVSVLIAACIIYFKPEWKIADPICTFIFSFFIFFTTIFIFRDIIFVLLERKPSHINYDKVEKHFSTIPGVTQVHNLRMWSITLKRTALNCHLVVDSEQNFQRVLEKAHAISKDIFKFSDITIQLEIAP